MCIICHRLIHDKHVIKAITVQKRSRLALSILDASQDLGNMWAMI